MVEALLADGSQTGDVRDDIAPGELASFCLHALTAAGDLPSEAAVHRLVTVTLTGVRPSPADAADAPPHTDGTARPPHHQGRHSVHGPHSAGS
ncbi:hypothetical protein [Streptomyces sp. NPDC050263]|uniref:SbtR family transcriptional regulator n=1 Tax=Streptomyces sp. NPDC050263 TaxID=3155037 RepID=UPI00341F0CB8